MTKIKIHGWDKKPRTMLRFIKIGDIFCFQYDEKSYGFGQIIGKTSVGHVIQLFNLFKSQPLIEQEELKNIEYFYKPVILDTYSLFDKKREGKWQIIGHQSDFDQAPFKSVEFKWGDPNGNRFGKTDLNGNILGRDFTKEDVKNLISESPNGDDDIKWIIQKNL